MASVSNPPQETFEDEDDGKKSGTFEGVFNRVVTTIFGVIMFVRMGWMVSTVGLLISIGILVVSVFVSVTTTLSMSALLTNGKMMTGGPYYLISRTLGMGIGSMIGILFFCAQLVAISFNNTGFAEEVARFYEGTFTGSRDWDVVFLTFATNFLMFIFAWFGQKFMTVLGIVFLVLIFVAFFSFLAGTLIRKPGFLPGYTSYSLHTLQNNLAPPTWESPNPLFTACGVFFPGVTGIMQGMSMTHELKNPSRSVPLGTMMAILVSYLLYLIIMILNAWTAEASLLGNIIDYSYMTDISVWKPLVFMGSTSAALSASLDQVASGARIIAAILDDGIFPFLKFLTILNKNGDPVYGYAFCAFWTSIVTMAFVGKLDSIGPFLTCLYMVVYATLNFSCFINAHLKTPSWRPTFKYYNKWVSLLSAIVCIGFSFLSSYIFASVSIVVALILYIYCSFNHPDLDVGGAAWSRSYATVIANASKLEKESSHHVTTFLPSFLVLTNYCNPLHMRHVMETCSLFYKARGVMMVGTVVEGSPQDRDKLNKLSMLPMSYELRHNQLAFHQKIICPSIRTGTLCVMQSAGLGAVSPRIMTLEYPENWRSMEDSTLDDFVGAIRDALLLRKSIMIVRLPARVTATIEARTVMNNAKISAAVAAAAANGDIELLQKLGESAHLNQNSILRAGVGMTVTAPSGSNLGETAIGDVDTQLKVIQDTIRTVKQKLQDGEEFPKPQPGATSGEKSEKNNGVTLLGSPVSPSLPLQQVFASIPTSTIGESGIGSIELTSSPRSPIPAHLSIDIEGDIENMGNDVNGIISENSDNHVTTQPFPVGSPRHLAHVAFASPSNDSVATSTNMGMGMNIGMGMSTNSGIGSTTASPLNPFPRSSSASAIPSSTLPSATLFPDAGNVNSARVNMNTRAGVMTSSIGTGTPGSSYGSFGAGMESEIDPEMGGNTPTTMTVTRDRRAASAGPRLQGPNFSALRSRRSRSVGHMADFDDVGRVIENGDTEHHLEGIELITKDEDEKFIEGNIDVHWLADDGGLSILLAFLLARNAEWRGSTIRTFVPSRGNERGKQQAELAALLKAVRIKSVAATLDEMDISPPTEDVMSNTTLRPPAEEVDTHPTIFDVFGDQIVEGQDETQGEEGQGYEEDGEGDDTQGIDPSIVADGDGSGENDVAKKRKERLKQKKLRRKLKSALVNRNLSRFGNITGPDNIIEDTVDAVTGSSLGYLPSHPEFQPNRDQEHEAHVTGLDLTHFTPSTGSSLPDSSHKLYHRAPTGTFEDGEIPKSNYEMDPDKQFGVDSGDASDIESDETTSGSDLTSETESDIVKKRRSVTMQAQDEMKKINEAKQNDLSEAYDSNSNSTLTLGSMRTSVKTSEGGSISLPIDRESPPTDDFFENVYSSYVTDSTSPPGTTQQGKKKDKKEKKDKKNKKDRKDKDLSLIMPMGDFIPSPSTETDTPGARMQREMQAQLHRQLSEMANLPEMTVFSGLSSLATSPGEHTNLGYEFDNEENQHVANGEQREVRIASTPRPPKTARLVEGQDRKKSKNSTNSNVNSQGKKFSQSATTSLKSSPQASPLASFNTADTFLLPGSQTNYGNLVRIGETANEHEYNHVHKENNDSDHTSDMGSDEIEEHKDEVWDEVGTTTTQKALSKLSRSNTHLSQQHHSRPPSSLGAREVNITRPSLTRASGSYNALDKLFLQADSSSYTRGGSMLSDSSNSGIITGTGVGGIEMGNSSTTTSMDNTAQLSSLPQNVTMNNSNNMTNSVHNFANSSGMSSTKNIRGTRHSHGPKHIQGSTSHSTQTHAISPSVVVSGSTYTPQSPFNMGLCNTEEGRLSHSDQSGQSGHSTYSGYSGYSGSRFLEDEEIVPHSPGALGGIGKKQDVREMMFQLRKHKVQKDKSRRMLSPIGDGEIDGLSSTHLDNQTAANTARNKRAVLLAASGHSAGTTASNVPSHTNSLSHSMNHSYAPALRRVGSNHSTSSGVSGSLGADTTASLAGRIRKHTFGDSHLPQEVNMPRKRRGHHHHRGIVGHAHVHGHGHGHGHTHTHAHGHGNGNGNVRDSTNSFMLDSQNSPFSPPTSSICGNEAIIDIHPSPVSQFSPGHPHPSPSLSLSRNTFAPETELGGLVEGCTGSCTDNCYCGEYANSCADCVGCANCDEIDSHEYDQSATSELPEGKHVNFGDTQTNVIDSNDFASSAKEIRQRMKQFQAYGDAIRTKSADSKNPSKVTIVSLPLPAILFSNTEWLSWLEALSEGVPGPVIFVRGSETFISPYM